MGSAVWLAVAWSLAVLLTDLTVRRIPNLLNLAGLMLALAAFVATGVSLLGIGAAQVALGVLLALALAWPGFRARWLGGGDVKLLVVIALLGGVQAVLVSFVIAALLGGIAVLFALLMARMQGARWSGRWLPFGAALSAGFLAMVLARP